TFTLAEHLQRLARSAEAVKMSLPLDVEALAEQIRKLITASGVREGMIYLQLSRGVSPRNHVIPTDIKPTLLFYARPLPPAPIPGEGEGVKLLAVSDERWKRCWIKSIALLPNILAKSEAVAGGYDEAVFIEHGVVTECSASNVYAIVEGKLVTHPVGSKVLPGITRAVLFECAAELRITVDERPLREEEAIRSAEVFITSTTREVNWVARWNDRYIGQGRCGPVTLALHRALQARVRKETVG
ncbi:MAG TPA: aminotransferase class IV, partial [Humisphaera sp.]|nr:aminotransferase class IV [Humisphaera sp.]